LGILFEDVYCVKCNGLCGSVPIMIKNGNLCRKCAYPCVELPFIKTKSEADINEYLAHKEQNKKLLQTFKETRSLGDYIVIDDNNKLWYLGSCDSVIPKDKMLSRMQALQINIGKQINISSDEPYVFSFDDIIDYELVENGETITKGGVGTAAVGGAFFGGTGAITGAILGKKTTSPLINDMHINITTNNKYIPLVRINMVNGQINKNGFAYNTIRGKADSILSSLSQICAKKKPILDENPTFSVADELTKYKQLLDSNVITNEEFEAAKKKLLGV